MDTDNNAAHLPLHAIGSVMHVVSGKDSRP